MRSVSDIALDCGFNSHDTFIRAFRRITRKSPSEFRDSMAVVRGVMIIPGMAVFLLAQMLLLIQQGLRIWGKISQCPLLGIRILNKT